MERVALVDLIPLLSHLDLIPSGINILLLEVEEEGLTFKQNYSELMTL
jgi:hypothetical protein